MEKLLKIATIFFVLTTLVIFTACDNPSGGSGTDSGSGSSSGSGLTAGDTATFTADGVSFVISYVPGGLTFPTGVDDDGSATVSNAYWIADTETSYELWEKVYDWATDAARGSNIYTFANEGIMGDGSDDTNQHPVTTVNWRDSMVWCNALTEWYNIQEGTSYECVYTDSSAIIRDSRDANATDCDGAVAGTTADGFRLLTSDEYECAARYIDGTNWNGGDHVSGDTTASYDVSTVFVNYAVYILNGGLSTAAVKSKTANALDLYDMSGNVWEWCFTKSGSDRVARGGGWDSTADLRVGSWNSIYPFYENNSLGFRFARTAN